MNKMSDHLKSQFSQKLKVLQTPVFLAGLDDSSKPRLTVHIKSEAKNPFIGRQAGNIADAILNTRVRTRIRPHTPTALEKPRTLSGLLQSFQHDLIVYDPVLAFSRAKRIVAFAESLRISLGRKIAGIYFTPESKSLVVVLDGASYFTDGRLSIRDLRDTEKDVYASIARTFEGQLEQVPPVRIGFGFPEKDVVPVDMMSGTKATGKVIKHRLARIAAAAMIGAGMTAGQTAAADGPAVEAGNSQISAAYVDLGGDGGGAAGFNLAGNLSGSMGVQLDGVAGSADDEFFGIAGQIFFRNPDQGLIGLVASHADAGDLDMQRLGAKGELYLDQFTLAAQAGGQFSDDFGDGGYALIDLRWYASDNFYLSAGGDFSDDGEMGALKAEFRPGFEAIPGLSFFGETTFGSDGDDSFLIGLRSHFYGQGTLKDRDRKYLAGDEAFNLLRSVAAMKDQAGYGAP